MRLEKIITLANNKVRIPFLAMERSLRSSGCELPIWVIPYDDDLFDLPRGSEWWEIPEIIDWIKSEKCHPSMRKYQCLVVSNYQFVDTDICFFRNPSEVLVPFTGFITSCGHWRDPTHTCTPSSQEFIKRSSTMWQYKVFNSGQFACDKALFNISELIQTAMQPEFIDTCIRWPHNEQPGMNLLIISSDIEISNLTLPPTRMESTWAGDYINGYDKFWIDDSRKPYLIHWAGDKPRNANLPIDKLFFNFLSDLEKERWDKENNLKKNIFHRIKFQVMKKLSFLRIIF